MINETIIKRINNVFVEKIIFTQYKNAIYKIAKISYSQSIFSLFWC